MKFFPKAIIFTLFVITTVLNNVSAQDLNPIRWTLEKEKSAVKSGQDFTVKVTAAIDEGWHLYSLKQPAGGPIPTRIFLSQNPDFKLGEIESPMPETVFDKNFNMETEYYEKTAEFILPIELKETATSGKKTLAVNAFFQSCNATTCLPPRSFKMTTEIEILGEDSSQISATTDKPTNPQTVLVSANTNKNADSKPKIDFDFTDFEGKARKFSEFKGKIVLLDFWATWCSPCLKDIPKLKAVYDKYKAQDFEIIGLNSEAIGDDVPDEETIKESFERAKQIVKARGVNWTQVSPKISTELAKTKFAVKSLPTKILIDKEGNIVATLGEKDDMEKAVADLISKK